MFSPWSFIYALFFGGIGYLLFCIDPDDKGPLPWISRKLTMILNTIM